MNAPRYTAIYKCCRCLGTFKHGSTTELGGILLEFTEPRTHTCPRHEGYIGVGDLQHFKLIQEDSDEGE